MMAYPFSSTDRANWLVALCGLLERAVNEGVLTDYYLKGGVAMELRFAGAAREG
jgi:hypothetical protein